LHASEGRVLRVPHVEAVDKRSEDFSEFLVKRAHVVTVPGSAFGNHGEDYIRISYAASFELLENALDRIETAVNSLR